MRHWMAKCASLRARLDAERQFRLWMRLLADKESRGRQPITLSERAWTQEELTCRA